MKELQANLKKQLEQERDQLQEQDKHGTLKKLEKEQARQNSAVKKQQLVEKKKKKKSTA